jgi:predicted nucleic acid-binding protein
MWIGFDASQGDEMPYLQGYEMPYLVDTDVLIDVGKRIHGAIEYLNSLEETWSISIITGMELIVGARNKREVQSIDRFLTGVPSLPLNGNIGAKTYALLAEFARSHGLRVFDAIIAATAIQTGCMLVTRNAKHFRMISDLRLDIPKYCPF